MYNLKGLLFRGVSFIPGHFAAKCAGLKERLAQILKVVREVDVRLHDLVRSSVDTPSHKSS